jgi:hypothetical protein
LPGPGGWLDQDCFLAEAMVECMNMQAIRNNLDQAEQKAKMGL